MAAMPRRRAALEPDVYRCAICVAGISDMKRFIDWETDKHEFGSQVCLRSLDRFPGVSGPLDPVVDPISLIRHMAAVHIPVLLIHGRDDTVVPCEHSTLMLEALRRARQERRARAVEGGGSLNPLQ